MWNDFSDVELFNLAIAYCVPCSFDPDTNTLYERDELEAALTEVEYNIAYQS